MTYKAPQHARDHRPAWIEGGPGSDPFDWLPQPGDGPIVFRAAVGAITDPEANRVHYVDQDEGDNIYWDEWDANYDPTIFSIEPYRETNDPDEGEVIAGVQLMKRGLYSIHAIVDLDDYINGVTLFKSNYDEGQGEFRAHANIGSLGEPYYGDLYGIRLDHWRAVYTDDPSPEDYTHDGLFGGGANTVEIVMSVNTQTAMPGVTPGKYVAGTPTPGLDFWVPGGDDGAWGLTPNLLVAYWGLSGMPSETWQVNDDDWPPVTAW